MNILSSPLGAPAYNRPRRIAFLYNHDAAHQVRHSAIVIPQILERHGDIDITVLGSSKDILSAVREVCGPDIESRIEIVELSRPKWRRFIGRILDGVAPFSRLDHLYSNRARFAPFDAVVVTEGTSLFLKKLRGLRDLKIIRVDHGAGDRAVGFQPSFGDNDLVLIAGSKQRDRFRSLGYLREDQMVVVGYTKFDAVDRAAKLPKLFPNDKPVVLYNPHPDPRLSSWYRMGLKVLDFFRQSTEYNLIFAPHVMMFKRRFHISLESWAMRLRRDLPARFKECPHIFIDTGSASSINMTYTLNADIYLGDVSSQVYEFLITPRPCIFLDAHATRWQDDPNYAFWRCGPVLNDISMLADALKNADGDQARFRPVQEEAFRATFDLQSTPASVRAADAIVGFLRNAPRRP